MRFGVVWLLLMVLLGVGIIAFELNIYILVAVGLFLCIIISLLENYFGITSKPLMSVKAKVIDKWTLKGYVIRCSLPDKKDINLRVSKKQWCTLKKKDIVYLIYQGIHVHSIKKCPNGVVIFYDKSSKKFLEEKSNQIMPYK